MKRPFLVSVFALAPFTAFAGGLVAAGDQNTGNTSVSSSAGVSSTQNTGAGTAVNGRGAVMVGALSGNYNNVQTGAAAVAGPQGSATNTTAQQINLGGSISGGMSTGHNATGQAGGAQNSQGSGNAGASASNTNMGGFVKFHH